MITVNEILDLYSEIAKDRTQDASVRIQDADRALELLDKLDQEEGKP